MMMVVKESGIGAGWANTTLHDLPRLLNMAWPADKNGRVGGGGHRMATTPRRAEICISTCTYGSMGLD